MQQPISIFNQQNYLITKQLIADMQIERFNSKKVFVLEFKKSRRFNCSRAE